MQVCQHFPLTDALIRSFSSSLAGDLPAYRNHVCRVLNYFRAITSTDGTPPDVVLIAAAFHDIGIWTDDTFDYLAPSVARASAYLSDRRLAHLDDEVRAIITEHHKLRPYTGANAVHVEAFRRADLVDVSLGLVRSGVPRSFIRAVQAAFPNEGFHRRLASLAARQVLRSPLRPLPMIHW